MVAITSSFPQFMRYALLILIFFIARVLPAADYQWSVPVAGVTSSETGKSPRAFLWIPPTCERVKGIVYAPQNMLEEPIIESEAFRQRMAKLDFAIVWLVPSPGGAAKFGREEQAAVESTLQALAMVSGYESMIAAPLVPMGHSAMAEFPYLMAARMPHRVLAGISLKGAWPEKQSWVPEFGKCGVPMLWVSGEYEWADERAGKAQAFRKQYPQSPFSMVAHAGGGHFDHEESLTIFMADYIAKAAQNDKRPVDATKTGVSIPRWKKTGNESFWCFDEEQRAATEKLQNIHAGKRAFLLGYQQQGQVIEQVNGTHEQVSLRWLPTEEQPTFELTGTFLNQVPAGRPERWVGQKADTEIAHPTTVEGINISRITGPMEQVSPNRFRLRMNRANFDNPPRGAEMWFQCEHAGDGAFQRSVQQAVLRFPLQNKADKVQTITFEAIPDQVAGGTKPIELKATSDSGMKVEFYVREGPAEVVGDSLRLNAIPKKATFPITVSVVAWQWGRDREPFVQTATPVVRTFRITKSGAEETPSIVKIDASLDLTKPGNAVPTDFAGLSREWRRFPAPALDQLDKVHPTYRQLLRNLRGLGIRIGGASADGMKAPPDVERLKQLAQVHAAVEAPMIITINLAHNDVELCKAWIQRVKENLPQDAVRGFELGNEPDGWFGRHKPKDYKWETYFEEFAAMRAQLVPSVIPALIGPSWAHGLPPDIAAVMMEKNPGSISMLTGHAYAFPPTVGREVFRLLREDPIQKSIEFLAPGIEAAKKAGVPFRLDEAGSAWGGGARGFSDSFAAALWILDFQLSLAQAGLAGINFHGGGKGHYSAIQDDTDDKKPVPTWIRAMPTYYGLLVFQETTAHGARLIPVKSDASKSVKLWATQDAKGTVRVLAINKDLGTPADVSIQLDKPGVATLKRLEAPAIAVSEGVRWAGQTFDDTPDGKPVGELKLEQVRPQNGKFSFRVGPVSAALLTVE